MNSICPAQLCKSDEYRVFPRVVEIYQNKGEKMEFYESKMEFSPYFLNLMLYFVAQAQTFLDFSKMSPELPKWLNFSSSGLPNGGEKAWNN